MSTTTCGRFAVAIDYLRIHRRDPAACLKRDRRLLAEDPFQRAEIRRLIGVVPAEDGAGRDKAAGARARLQAADDPGLRSAARLIRRCCALRAVQHPPSYEATSPGCRAHAQWIAGERLSYADLSAAADRFCARLSRRDRLERHSRWPRNGTSGIKSRPSVSGRCSLERVRGITPVSHYADLDF